MKIGDKIICSDETEYKIVKPSDRIADFGLLDCNGIEVTCLDYDWLKLV